MPRILIIDDDPDWCEGSLKNPLLHLGHQITTTRERLQALCLVQNEAFDLVILNIRLGYQLSDDKITSQWTELLDLTRYRGAKVIVVTSRSFPAHIQLHRLLRMAFKDYKVTDFLIKEDFDVREYRRVVQETMSQELVQKQLRTFTIQSR
jgi:CheY-like chemotaxis protein